MSLRYLYINGCPSFRLIAHIVSEMLTFILCLLNLNYLRGKRQKTNLMMISLLNRLNLKGGTE